MKIHHTGLIVKDLDKSIAIYEKMGYAKVSDIIYDGNQNIMVAFIRSQDGMQLLELVKAIDETSSIYRFKEGYHHICYEVEKPDGFKEEFKKLKIGRIFFGPISAPAIVNRQVMFGCLNNGTFVEFLL